MASFPSEISPVDHPRAPAFRLKVRKRFARPARFRIITNGASRLQLLLIDAMPTAAGGAATRTLATAEA